MSFIFAVSGQKSRDPGLQQVLSTVLIEATHPNSTAGDAMQWKAHLPDGNGSPHILQHMEKIAIHADFSSNL